MMKTGWLRAAARTALIWCGMGLLGAAWGQTSAPAAGSAGLSFGPEPSWIVQVAAPLDAEPPVQGLSQGRYYLLADQQLRVSGKQQVRYWHLATKAVNERGVEQLANVQIRFDPSYQRLVIHRIEVRRAGQLVSRAQPSSVKLLQREASLESLIFDGSLTAHAALSDVRVGDVVEYSYSLEGSNPVFGGIHFGSFDLEWDMPVARMHSRLLWPKGRALHWRYHNHAQPPSITELGSELDHRWDARDVAGQVPDTSSPGWWDPYDWVEWGEFANWADVARWALPLYQPPANSAALKGEVERIAAQHAEPEQRLLAALRFVQREVRYLGIEIGANSHAPHAPDLVLKRRFGDCKDKTLLSLALLQGLGIKAQAALVHTTQGRGIAERMPSPWAFNHVLVRAELAGKRIWLDPTHAPQGGADLAHWAQADFGRALVVDAATQDLVEMAGSAARHSSRRVHVLLNAEAGPEKPADLTITTKVSGVAADSLRDTLANNRRDTLQKQYLDYYSGSYPGAEVIEPFAVRDDIGLNQIEVVERYRLPSYWKRDDKKARWNGAVEVPDLLEWLRSPSSTQRSAPLALRHPVDFTLITELRLPGPWAVKPDQVRVDDPVFELTRDEVWKGSTLVLTDHYRSRADHVPAGEIARYTANLAKAREAVNYVLYKNDASAKTGSGGPHWLPLTWGIASLLLLGGLMLRLYRWDPAPMPASAPSFGPLPPVGLGGWLLLPVLGLFISAFRAAQSIWQGRAAMTVDGWSALTQVDSPAYHALWAPTLLLEQSLHLGLIGGAILLLMLVRSRRTSVRWLFIGQFALGVVTSLAEFIAAQLIPAVGQQWTDNENGAVLRNLIFSTLWIAYFLRSQRVQATFTGRLTRSAEQGGQSNAVPAEQSPVAEPTADQMPKPAPEARSASIPSRPIP